MSSQNHNDNASHQRVGYRIADLTHAVIQATFQNLESIKEIFLQKNIEIEQFHKDQQQSENSRNFERSTEVANLELFGPLFNKAMNIPTQLNTEIDQFHKEIKLTNLIKNQKQKIFNDFLNILPEKELVRQLIVTYLEYKKGEKNRAPSLKLKKECCKIEGELEGKLGEEFVENLQLILNDCEELVRWETELDEIPEGKAFLIKEQKNILQTTDDSKNRRFVEQHKAIHKDQIRRRDTISEMKILELSTELKVRREEMEETRKMINAAINNRFEISGCSFFNVSGNLTGNINQITYQIQYKLIELKRKYQALDSTNKLQSDQQKLKKTILVLAAKRIFATARKDTIDSLITIYNKLDDFVKKFGKLATLTRYIGDLEEIISILPGGTIFVKLLEKDTLAIINIFKKHSAIEHAQKFEDYLVEDKKALTLLQETYQSLASSIQENQTRIRPVISQILKLNQNHFSQYGNFFTGEDGELLQKEVAELLNNLVNQ
ncbi:12848_t:CDS:2, partial [Racocetra fulgida]